MKKPTRKPARRMKEAPKECYFCKEKKEPSFADIEVLHRYTTDRGRIIARLRSGVCGVHHRRLTAAIKYARHLALIPFVAL